MPVRKDNRRQDDQNKNMIGMPRTKKVCVFCQEKKRPTFTDTITLKRFVSDRSKIISKLRSGACSKHQRQIARQVKYARHLALLPFTTRI